MEDYRGEFVLPPESFKPVNSTIRQDALMAKSTEYGDRFNHWMPSIKQCSSLWPCQKCFYTINIYFNICSVSLNRCNIMQATCKVSFSKILSKFLALQHYWKLASLFCRVYFFCWQRRLSQMQEKVQPAGRSSIHSQHCWLNFLSEFWLKRALSKLISECYTLKPCKIYRKKKYCCL